MSASLPPISSCLPSYLNEPYLNSEGPSVMVDDRRVATTQRYDPFLPQSEQWSLHVQFDYRTLPADYGIIDPVDYCSPYRRPRSQLKKGWKDPKDLVRPKEDYGPFDPDRVLPEDPKMRGLREDDKKICWFFLLTLLMDPSKKHIVAWTGRGREFIITSIPLLLPIWSNVQGFARTIQIDSFRRNLRSCYKKRILIPVDAKANRFAFHTEPSVHVGMTREKITEFIAAHSLAAPATSASHQPLVNPMMTYPTPPPSSTIPLFDEFSPIVPFLPIPEYSITPSTVSLPDPTVVTMHQPPACQFVPHIDQPHSQPVVTDLSSYWSPPPMTNFYPHATQFPGQYYPPGSNGDYYGNYY